MTILYAVFYMVVVTGDLCLVLFVFLLAKNCGPLRAPINGSSLGNQFTFPNKIHFQCDEGFILKGSELRQCQASSVWSGNDTFCEG